MKITYTVNFSPDKKLVKPATHVVEQALSSAKTILKQMSKKNTFTWSKNIEIDTKPIPDETT